MKQTEQTILRRFSLRDYGILLVIAILFILGSLLSPQFLHVGNLTNILRQASIQGFVALGMTFVILSGGIDLSIGSVVALASVLVAGYSRTLPAIIGIFIALAPGSSSAGSTASWSRSSGSSRSSPR